MAEPLRFKTQDGREFILEFNRRTVQLAERNGFDVQKVDEKMMNGIPDLFFYAFKMHHAWIKKEETDRILFEEFKGLTTDEMKRLVELYTAPYDTLLHNDGEGEEKNSRTVTILN